MSFEQYLNVAAQNVDWLITIGIVVCSSFLITFNVSLRHKVYRLQEQLARLSDDVAALRVAEERRFFTELSPVNAGEAHELRAARTAGKIRLLRDDGDPAPPTDKVLR